MKLLIKDEPSGYIELAGVEPATASRLIIMAIESGRAHAVAHETGEVFDYSDIFIKREAERRFHK